MDQTPKPEKPERARRHSLIPVRNAARHAAQLDDPLRMLRVTEVAALLQLHPMTIWDWTKHGKFPRPLRLGPQTVVWKASEVQAWLDAKAAETDETSAPTTAAKTTRFGPK